MLCRVLGVRRKVHEYVVVEVWVDRRKIGIINYYNAQTQLLLNELEKVEGQNGDCDI